VIAKPGTATATSETANGRLLVRQGRHERLDAPASDICTPPGATHDTTPVGLTLFGY
jgi:hypothetical protein